MMKWCNDFVEASSHKGWCLLKARTALLRERALISLRCFELHPLTPRASATGRGPTAVVQSWNLGYLHNQKEMQSSTPVSELVTVTQELGSALLHLSVLKQGDRGCWPGNSWLLMQCLGTLLYNTLSYPSRHSKTFHHASCSMQIGKRQGKGYLHHSACNDFDPSSARKCCSFQLQWHEKFQGSAGHCSG